MTTKRTYEMLSGLIDQTVAEAEKILSRLETAKQEQRDEWRLEQSKEQSELEEPTRLMMSPSWELQEQIAESVFGVLFGCSSNRMSTTRDLLLPEQTALQSEAAAKKERAECGTERKHENV